jgi:hypothetical protein
MKQRGSFQIKEVQTLETKESERRNPQYEQKLATQTTMADNTKGRTHAATSLSYVAREEEAVKGRREGSDQGREMP